MCKLTEASQTGGFSAGSSAISKLARQKLTRELQRLSLGPALVPDIRQEHECMDYFGRSQVLVAAGSLAAFATASAATRSLSGSIVALIYARVCVLLTYDVPVTRLVLARLSGSGVSTSLVPSWSAGRLAILGLKTLPLGILAVLVVGKPVLGTLFKPECAVRAPQFVWLAVVMPFMFLASFLGQAIIIACFDNGRFLTPSLPAGY